MTISELREQIAAMPDDWPAVLCIENIGNVGIVRRQTAVLRRVERFAAGGRLHVTLCGTTIEPPKRVD